MFVKVLSLSQSPTYTCLATSCPRLGANHPLFWDSQPKVRNEEASWMSREIASRTCFLLTKHLRLDCMYLYYNVPYLIVLLNTYSALHLEAIRVLLH